MPSLKRLRARIVALVIIMLTALHSTIAKPTEPGEGEASITNDYVHPSMMMMTHMQPDMLMKPQMFMSFEPYQLQASNVQINYNDDRTQEGGLISEDETLRNEAVPSQNMQRRFNYKSEDELRVSDDDVDDEDDRSLNEMLNKIEKIEKVSFSRPKIELSKNNDEPHSIEDEERTFNDQPKTIKLDDGIELVTPKHVFIGPMEDDLAFIEPSSLHDEDLMRRIHPALSSDDAFRTINQDKIKRQFDEKVDKPSFQDEAPTSFSDDEEDKRVPVQDVGEQEDAFEKSDDEMTAENSQNIAYSYSQFQPNYQLAPNHQPEGNERLVDHKVPQLSFIFHPTLLRGTQPNLILQQLKSFAVQLDDSPIMNALFSPSTVPIPPTQPAWPSKYEAQKYLPPNLSLKDVPGGYQPELRKSLNIGGKFLDPKARGKLENQRRHSEHPYLRRSMIQVDTNGLSQESLDNLGRIPPRTISTIIQNSMAHNAEAFNNFMQQSFTFPQTLQVSQAFERGTNAMNSFFNNQLRLPQYPTFPSYANQFHIQNNRVFSPNQVPNQPFYPQLPMQTFPTTYISPSLREIVDSADGIDVRIDARPDSEIDKTLNTDLQNGSQVVQLGDGNTNYDGQVEVVQMSDDVEEEIKEVLSMNGLKAREKIEARTNDDEVGNDDVPDVEDLKNTQSDLTKEVDDPLAKYDIIKADAEEGIMDQVADYLMTEEPVKDINDMNSTTNPGLSDENSTDDQLKEESVDDSITTISPNLDEVTVTELNDVEQTTMVNDEVDTTMMPLDDEDSFTTESAMNDEMTTELLQDETTTQFEVSDRISPTLVATLSG